MITEKKVKEDVWIPSCCNMCFNNCSILVHRVDGVVVKIEGDPKGPVGQGRICGKGAAGIMQLYDEHRQSKPLKRTNPEKGIGIDPGWVEISWEEAYSILVEKYQEASKKGPNNFMTYFTVANLPGSILASAFHGAMFGVTQGLGPDICGAGVHAVSDLVTGTGNAMPDYKYCKYLIQFGTQAGTATRHGFNMTVKRLADARINNGLKLVAVDPHMGGGAEKADTWLPIRPGTDGALALAIAYVLVYEENLYDKNFLKKYTNAGSLVNVKTGRIIREKNTNKALVWDLADGKVKPYDDSSLNDVALEGTFEVDGIKCKTGFQLYKENLRKYTPEKAEEITTIPAAKIRQVAREFGQAACIGQTIVIDGVELPYRPACADCFSGVSRHKHSFLSHWCVMSLNVLIGSATSPGGFIGFGPACNGFSDDGTPSWRPTVWEEDGLLNYIALLFPAQESYYRKIREGIVEPTDQRLMSLMPYGMDSHFCYMAQTHPERYHTQQAEFLFTYASNPLKNWGNHGEMAEFLKSFKFIVGIDIYLNDSSYFYDLFLPEASYLERYEILPHFFYNHHTIGGLDSPWAVGIRQPTVEPRDGIPSLLQILAELADRMGGNMRFNGALSMMYRIKPEYMVPMDRKLTPEVMLDAVYRSLVGPDHGLEWFKKNGVYTYPRKVNEVYILQESGGRLPVYMDNMLEAKEKISALTKKLNIPWETDDYLPVPDWKPCDDYTIKDRNYDLLPIYYTNSINVDTWMLQNAWINEINENEPWAYNIEINRNTAEKKGLKNGDKVVLKARNGYQVEGRVTLSEGVHPEVLAVIGGSWGSQSAYLPNSKGKGVPINNLLEATDPKRMDHICAAFDQCVRVKIEKI